MLQTSFISSNKSLMEILKINGSRINPWGTTWSTGLHACLYIHFLLGINTQYLISLQIYSELAILPHSRLDDMKNHIFVCQFVLLAPFDVNANNCPPVLIGITLQLLLSCHSIQRLRLQSLCHYGNGRLISVEHSDLYITRFGNRV